jgi:hypothetical protein
VTGTITFQQMKPTEGGENYAYPVGCNVTVAVNGLALLSGSSEYHIHEFGIGNEENDECEAKHNGYHYNPDGK